MKSTKIIKIIKTLFILVIVFSIMWELYVEIRQSIDCSRATDKVNVLQYIEFVGDVGDKTKENIERILKNEVPDEALNYLINGSGKIVIVYNENRDVTDYLNENYGFNLPKTDVYISGTNIPYHDLIGNLVKIDVVIATNNLFNEEIGHELAHTYDLIKGNLSDKSDFMEIYNNRENVSKKVLSQAVIYRDYYESKPTEYFAELCKRYMRGDFRKGYNDEMDMVIDYFDKLGIKKE